MTDLGRGKFDDRTATPMEANAAIAHAIDLLTYYSFDLGSRTAQQLLDHWLTQYQPMWIRWAVIEALYQGRYKAVSVDQILQLWERRNQPCFHFSYEFERLVCNKFPRNLAGSAALWRTSQNLTPLDCTVLPSVPTPAPLSARPQRETPAWFALVEQMPQAEFLEELRSSAEATPPPSATAIESSPTLDSEPEPDREVIHRKFHRDDRSSTSATPDAEPLLRSATRLQAGVEALIEQATSSLNASSEAGKTKLLSEVRSDEARPLGTPSIELEPPAAEPTAPPALQPSSPSEGSAIHQFTPSANPSDFHSKLKAVSEKAPKTIF